VCELKGGGQRLSLLKSVCQGEVAIDRNIASNMAMEIRQDGEKSSLNKRVRGLKGYGIYLHVT
jgi:hypothetical protein